MTHYTKGRINVWCWCGQMVWCAENNFGYFLIPEHDATPAAWQRLGSKYCILSERLIKAEMADYMNKQSWAEMQTFIQWISKATITSLSDVTHTGLFWVLRSVLSKMENVPQKLGRTF